MIQPYIIKKGDMVLQPCSLSTGKYEGSYLLKYKDDSKVLKERVPKIIDRSCRFYGSSYHFKKEDTMRITGISSKPPILFTPLFPTYFSQRTLIEKKKILGLIFIMFTKSNH